MALPVVYFFLSLTLKQPEDRGPDYRTTGLSGYRFSECVVRHRRTAVRPHASA